MNIRPISARRPASGGGEQRMRGRRALSFALSLMIFAQASAAAPASRAAEAPCPTHGIAMHGAPALPSDFHHFPYAEPGAKPGGKLALAYARRFRQPEPL